MERMTMFRDTDRYFFDFGPCSPDKGWAQIDTKQDASWYGTWTNPDLFQIVSFAEGDITMQTAKDAAEYHDAIRELARWNDEHEWGPMKIDPGLKPEMREKFIRLSLGDLLH